MERLFRDRQGVVAGEAELRRGEPGRSRAQSVGDRASRWAHGGPAFAIEVVIVSRHAGRCVSLPAHALLRAPAFERDPLIGNFLGGLRPFEESLIFHDVADFCTCDESILVREVVGRDVNDVEGFRFQTSRKPGIPVRELLGFGELRAAFLAGAVVAEDLLSRTRVFPALGKMVFLELHLCHRVDVFHFGSAFAVAVPDFISHSLKCRIDL